MTPEYINTNIRYIEPVYERRMKQVFEVGDVVMVGPAYVSTVCGVDRYVDDEVTGLVGVVIECWEPLIGPGIKTIQRACCIIETLKGSEMHFYNSRLILIRSEGTT